MKSMQIVIEVENTEGQISSSNVPIVDDKQVVEVMETIKKVLTGETPYLTVVSEDSLGQITRYIPRGIILRSIVYLRVFN